MTGLVLRPGIFATGFQVLSGSQQSKKCATGGLKNPCPHSEKAHEQLFFQMPIQHGMEAAIGRLRGHQSGRREPKKIRPTGTKADPESRQRKLGS
jgi:hypothetical protein